MRDANTKHDIDNMSPSKTPSILNRNFLQKLYETRDGGQGYLRPNREKMVMLGETKIMVGTSKGSSFDHGTTHSNTDHEGSLAILRTRSSDSPRSCPLPNM